MKFVSDIGERYIEVDAILPVPLYVHPSLEENYRLRHNGDDLDFTLDYIKQNYPDMSESFRTFWSQGLYSPCNMVITKPEILNELCEWMMPILMALHHISYYVLHYELLEKNYRLDDII